MAGGARWEWKPLSSLDPSDDRPRRGASRRRGAGAPAADRQALVRRRAVAGAAGLAVLILLLYAVKGCMDARAERAFKDYVRDVGGLVQDSREQSDGLFALLREPGDQSPVDLENSVNGFRVQADQVIERARDADHPDELSSAQRFLVDALELRRDGLAEVARELPSALGDQGRREAAARIAADMQVFLASDVLYDRRVVPALRGKLAEERLLDEVSIPTSRFLSDLSWLRPATVAQRVAQIRGGAEPAAPGLHGTGLGTVTVGGQTLAPGGPARISLAPGLAFAVQVQNQGTAAERDVNVTVSISGGGAPIELEGSVDEIPPGGSKTVTIPLPEPPPTDRPLTIRVAVAPVPGEKKVDNNRGSFMAVFSR